jgi:hypothetical protein
VPWPTDEEFKKAIKDRQIYGSGIANYVVHEYDVSLGSDVPSDKPQIEHILPQTLTQEWKIFFSPEEHEYLKNTWANLIPISSPLNKHVRQKGFSVKRKIYKNDSMYATPRVIAKEFNSWNIRDLNARAKKLQSFAVKRWQY